MIDILDEAPEHFGAREALLDLSFGLERFEKTSERLREGRLPAFAFTALSGTDLVGTVRLWQVADRMGRLALLLGPLAVAPQTRGQKLGDRLMRHALNKAALGGFGAVLLVGDLPYYQRFGFAAGLLDRVDLPGPVDRSRFLALDLKPRQALSLAGCLAAAGPSCPVHRGLIPSAAFTLPRRA